MAKFNVGDKIRYLGGDFDHSNDLTIGKIYVVSLDEDNDISILDDVGDYWFIAQDDDRYEHVVDEGKPVETSQDVIELLANLSHRLYEAERYIAMQKRENDLAHEHASELGRQIREQAYEINELYKAVADRG